MRYDVLHPYRATVLRELSTVLDDPKRSVRKEAVDARYVQICKYVKKCIPSNTFIFTEPTGEQISVSDSHCNMLIANVP